MVGKLHTERDDTNANKINIIDGNDNFIAVVFDEQNSISGRGRYAVLQGPLEIKKFYHSINELKNDLYKLDRPKSLQTHTGSIHAVGKFDETMKTYVPLCCASRSALRRYHFIAGVSGDVTCKRCLNIEKK